VQIEVPGPQECPVTLLNPSFLPLVALPLETAAARPQDALQDGSFLGPVSEELLLPGALEQLQQPSSQNLSSH
jgi:hypothetical protein